jgi:hypothetical protein
MPFVADTSKAAQSFHDNAIDFEYTSVRSGKTLVLDYSLKTLRDHVTVKEVPEHLATLDRIFDNLGYRVPMNPSPEGSGQRNWPFLVFIGFVVAVAFVAARVVTRRRRSQGQVTRRTGEDPSNPIAVADSDAMLRSLLKKSCRCGKQFDLDDQSPHAESLFYDGDRITAFRIHCASCNSDQDVYFKEAQKAELKV